MQVYGNNLDAYGAVTYILSKIYRNILIIDTSTGRDANTYGVIQLPDNITNDQKNTFDNLKNYVNKYLEFAIFAGPILKDGIPGNKVYKTLKKDEFDRILDYTEVLDNTNKR